MFEQKYSMQNQIIHVEYSTPKVSGPSEEPWFVQKYKFFISGSQADMRTLDSIVLTRTIDILLRIVRFIA